MKKILKGILIVFLILMMATNVQATEVQDTNNAVQDLSIFNMGIYDTEYKSSIYKLEKVLGFLFPQIPKDHVAREYIASNMIANILGLGWAATPLGLKAMEELSKLEEKDPTVKKGTASKAMCTFLIINVSSLQLIPVNVIAYRSQYGSINPTAVVGPGLVATLISTGVAVLFCRIMQQRK